MSSRQVDDCPWRLSDPQSRQAGETGACCGLLGNLTGVTERRYLAVDRSACEACCETFSPSEQDLNPVVASLLFQLADSIVQGNVATTECSTRQAEQLRTRALDNLPRLEVDDHEFHAEAVRPLSDFSDVTTGQLTQLIPPPRTTSDPVSDWAVGVTTTARRSATLSSCLERLTAAGWETPVLFIDGSEQLPEAIDGLPFTRRDRATGAWPNSYLALLELYLRDPHADVYLLVQDDVIFPGTPAVREYLEHVLWPGDRPGIVSLFCSSQYTQECPGWYAIDGAWVWGAQALAFHPQVLARFLTDPAVFQHRTRTDKERSGLTHVDVLIGQWAERHHVPVWYPCPSLAQHIGHVSTLWETSRALGLRRADRYVEDFLFSDAT